MAKILEFRLPEAKALSAEQLAQQILTPIEAVNAIVTGMVCHVMPLWIEKKWPFRALELMAEELHEVMSYKVPDEVHRYQVDAIVEELKPVWYEIASQALYIF